jgi:poly(beta-D-mannuronate) lyase
VKNLAATILALAAVIDAYASSAPGEFRVSSAAELALLADKLNPGDVVVLAERTWSDQEIVFSGTGTREKPITFRAAKLGATVLTGTSSVQIVGDHLVVSGLSIKQGHTAKEGIAMRGRYCRLTETALTDSTYKFYVHVWGRENRVDHCYLAGKTSESPTMQIEAEGEPNRHQIDRNHFGARPALGKNGGETIRVGYSHQSMSTSATVVEDNLFDRCDGELEVISNKSCGNVYRRNTFRQCAGMLTLRHGNGCLVEGNFFLGEHKRGSGGIRVIGEDHVIINNYIDGVEKGGVWITAGIPDSPLVGYFVAKNCLIAFNTIVDSQAPALELDAGFGSSKRSLRPEGITVANNLFGMIKDGPLLAGKEGAGFNWTGNVALVSERSVKVAPPGVRFVDGTWNRGGDAMWRPAGPGVWDAAEGKFPQVATDIDGQPRGSHADIGCDELSSERVVHSPLQTVDVGPSWMNRSDAR